MKPIFKFLVRVVLLAFIWFALSSLDFFRFQLNLVEGEAVLWRAVMAVVDALALTLILSRSQSRGIRLAAVLFLGMFGMKTVLTVVEATYLPMLQPMVVPLMVNGAIATLLMVILAVMVWGMGRPVEVKDSVQRPTWKRPWYQWLWRVPVLSFLWMVLFAVFGAVFFMNIAHYLDPQALAAYSNLDMPAWVLPFQGLRAALWVLLALPMVMQLEGGKKDVAWVTGLCFAAWMGSNLFMATDLPAGLRFAHLVEVSGESLAFGLLMVLLLAKRIKLSQTAEISAARETSLQASSD